MSNNQYINRYIHIVKTLRSYTWIESFCVICLFEKKTLIKIVNSKWFYRSTNNSIIEICRPRRNQLSTKKTKSSSVFWTNIQKEHDWKQSKVYKMKYFSYYFSFHFIIFRELQLIHQTNYFFFDYFSEDYNSFIGRNYNEDIGAAGLVGMRGIEKKPNGTYESNSEKSRHMKNI